MDDDDDDFDLIGPSEPAKPIDTASQQLRAWIDQYEEAVTNHYSPELRARLASNKLAGVAGDLKPSVIGSNTRCNVSLQGNGVKVRLRKPNLLTLTRSRIFRSSIKRNLLTFFLLLQILTASNNLSPNTPVIECKGKLMLATQHRQQLKQSRVTQPSPYVSYYHLNDKLEICLDGNTYGNDSRFVHYRSGNI